MTHEIDNVRDVHTHEQALLFAAAALENRDYEALATLADKVFEWIGDNDGLLRAIEEMGNAALTLYRNELP